MAKRYEFDEFEGRARAKAAPCVACEEMLADALDESLSEADRAWFDRHVFTCGDCSEMLADAQRGAAWLEMLKTPRPEPSARLVERILAQTGGLQGGLPGELRSETLHLPQMVPGVAPSAVPLAVPGNLLEFRPRAGRMANWSNVGRRGVRFEPRLAMTAAMAFFSIALTLNLTGVQLNRLHASDLSPSGLRRTYYTASAGAVRYYDNLRVVHVLESRVDDLRQAVADRAETPGVDQRRQPEIQPEAQPQPRPGAPKNEPEPKTKPGPGVSRQAAPAGRPELLSTREELPGDRRTVASLSKMRGAGGLG